MKRLLAFITLITAAAFPGILAAQNFDNSANASLTGTYFVRQVAFDSVTSVGIVGRARSITGNAVFDGNGNYTFTGQLSDSTVSSGQAQAFTVTGTYAVSASGLLEIQSPLTSGEVEYGGLGTSALVASASEGNVFDVLIGVPVGASSTNASLKGSYQVGAFDLPGGDITQSRNATFLINADGNGNLGTLSVVGNSANQGNNDITQSIAGAQYTLSSSGGTFTVPLASGSTAQTQFISGTKQFMVSSDGNILVGGALNGYDLAIGIRAASGNSGNASLSGTYYIAGADADVSSASSTGYYLDAFYGSINANGQGTLISHQRINPSSSPPYDYTADNEFTVGADGSVIQNFSKFYVGAGGQAVLLIGRSTFYSIELAVAAKATATAGTVYLNPVGVVNAATYAPVTNPIAPGEMIRLFGTGLAASSLTASVLPFPTNLGGVTVSINGRLAPIYRISANEVVCIVPFETSESYATITVTNNGTVSNAVTVYTEQSAPGAFTLDANGVGSGAVLHSNGTVVSSSSPAHVGETVASYLTGLGGVTPAINNGTAGPSSPLSTTQDQFYVYVDGQSATVTYAGLAPGYVGLYQVNFTIPTVPDQGNVYVDFQDGNYGAYTSMSTINVTSAAQAPSLSLARERRQLRPGRIRQVPLSSVRPRNRRTL